MARGTLYLPVMIAAAVAVTCAETLVVGSGVALALNKLGTNGPDILRGTNKSDHLLGRGGNDDLYGWGGTDNLQAGRAKISFLAENVNASSSPEATRTYWEDLATITSTAA
jgi:Ca2+-binding RTX toxin-like protein